LGIDQGYTTMHGQPVIKISTLLVSSLNISPVYW